MKINLWKFANNKRMQLELSTPEGMSNIYIDLTEEQAASLGASLIKGAEAEFSDLTQGSIALREDAANPARSDWV